MENKNIYIKGRYYDNYYIFKEDHVILQMIRKRDLLITETIIDEDDVDKCKELIWYPHNDKSQANHLIYIRNRDKHRLHRYIIGEDKIEAGKVVDHINRNTLDNRKSNLRIVTVFENNQNIGMNSRNTSGVKGVFYDKRRSKWVANIYRNGKTHFVRCYTLDEAINARIKLENEIKIIY